MPYSRPLALCRPTTCSPATSKPTSLSLILNRGSLYFSACSRCRRRGGRYSLHRRGRIGLTEFRLWGRTGCSGILPGDGDADRPCRGCPAGHRRAHGYPACDGLCTGHNDHTRRKKILREKLRSYYEE